MALAIASRSSQTLRHTFDFCSTALIARYKCLQCGCVLCRISGLPEAAWI